MNKALEVFDAVLKLRKPTAWAAWALSFLTTAATCFACTVLLLAAWNTGPIPNAIPNFPKFLGLDNAIADAFYRPLASLFILYISAIILWNYPLKRGYIALMTDSDIRKAREIIEKTEIALTLTVAIEQSNDDPRMASVVVKMAPKNLETYTKNGIKYHAHFKNSTFTFTCPLLDAEVFAYKYDISAPHELMETGNRRSEGRTILGIDQGNANTGGSTTAEQPTA